MRIAAQLYTVRDQLDRDAAGTLARLRSIGYQYVELAGLGRRTAAEWLRMLSDADLAPCSTHCPIERLESDLPRAIDEAHTLGVQYLVCPWLSEERRRDEASWKQVAAVLNTAGRTCRQHGIQLCYHHHSFEFVRLGDRTALELLFDETDPDCLHAELDTYWLRHGGADPVDWLRRLAGRCPLLHLKDMAADTARSFAPVGTGELDWPAILASATQAGVEWNIVEQDTCTGDPIDALATSRRNLGPLLATR